MTLISQFRESRRQQRKFVMCALFEIEETSDSIGASVSNSTLFVYDYVLITCLPNCISSILFFCVD